VSELPDTWADATIGEVANYISRGKSPKYTDQSDLPVVNQKAVRWSGIRTDDLKYVHPDQFEQWTEERFIQEGDILWNSTGTGTIGRACLVRRADVTPPKVVDTHVTIVRPNKAAIEPRYLFLWIRGPEVQQVVESLATGTTNQIELSRAAVAGTAVPLAPLQEQKRIADRLDAVLSRVDGCRARLSHVPEFIERFRESVLAAAICGSLTEGWRQENRPAVSGEMLLEDVRARHVDYEARLQAKKGSGKKTSRQQVSPNASANDTPVSAATDGLPGLPESWVWADAAHLVEPGAEIVYGIVQPGPKLATGVPYVRGMDIENGQILVDQLLKTSQAIAQRYSRSSLKGGDVLLGIIRATKVATVPRVLEGANITQGTARFRPSTVIRSRFLAAVLEAPQTQRWLHAHYRGIDMPGLNLADVRRTPIPLPPIEEQDEVMWVL
jgi:type I restriction enzyme, S subunit